MAEFKNPNQQGGGDNRSLLVMMLVLVTVFFGLQYFRAKNNPQTVPPNAAASSPQSAPTSGTQPSERPCLRSPARRAAHLPGSGQRRCCQ